jgi:penicillin-binding protein 2
MKRTSKIVTEGQQAFSFSRRSFFLTSAQLGVGGLLAARMGWLSIAQHEKYTLKSESNRVNLTLMPPRRGWIVDRNGLPLALNRTAFRVDIIPDRLTDKDKVISELQHLLQLPPDEVIRIQDELGKAAGFQPVVVAENIDWDHFAAVSIRAPSMPGVAPAQSFTRYYPEGAGVGHLVGYVGAATAEEYEASKDPLLVTPGFKVGKAGLEKNLDAVMRGKPGAKRTEVTARGKLVRDLASKADTAGTSIKLTIDAGLQAYAARRMGNESGSVVVLDCVTGDVLAMVSMPSFDPNSFSQGIGRLEWQMLREDDHIPMSNKTLQGLYPPGSTFKPLTTLALLEAGIDPAATVNCTGSYRIGGTIFHCASRRGHGNISMHRALVQSCDIYYYHFGRIAGILPIASMAKRLSIGQKYKLPYESQSYGTVPSPDWMEKKYKKQWSVADTVNTSIGQGYVLANPLQLATMVARIASGRQVVPRMFGAKKHEPALPLGINPEHLAFVREAMSGVVNGGGTAAKARMTVKGVRMAGKTGTAQVRRITMAERKRGVRSNASLPWKFRDHALFIGFAPDDNPRYAAACIIEHGGWGAGAAAPVVRDALTYMFDPEQAMATLQGLESGWGGDILTRTKKKHDAWMAEHDPATMAARAEAEAALKAQEEAANAANASNQTNNSVADNKAEAESEKAPEKDKEKPAPKSSAGKATPKVQSPPEPDLTTAPIDELPAAPTSAVDPVLPAEVPQ